MNIFKQYIYLRYENLSKILANDNIQPLDEIQVTELLEASSPVDSV